MPAAIVSGSVNVAVVSWYSVITLKFGSNFFVGADSVMAPASENGPDLSTANVSAIGPGGSVIA